LKFLYKFPQNQKHGNFNIQADKDIIWQKHYSDIRMEREY